MRVTGAVHVGRRSSARVDAILDRVDAALPLWDLCCDRGQIGCVAMDRHRRASVVFVDKRPRILEPLVALIAGTPAYTGRARIVCDDILDMALPAAPVNFVVAGVGTNLICAFLERLTGRVTDRLVCSTSQSPERFERLAAARGFVAADRADLASRHGRQTIWTLHRPVPEAGAGPRRLG